jgi:PST family polysaccharide transporter
VVIASVARSVARLVTLSAVTPRREWLEPCRITWARTRDLFSFGLPMAVATLASVGSRRWDNLVFSHHFGQGAAGIYNLAYNLADIPATQIAETLGDVMVPSFAEMEPGRRRRKALLLGLRQMMLLVAPLAFGLGAVAPALVRTFFDRRWARIEVELTILSVLSAVRPIGWIGSAYLQVEDRPRAIMILEIVKTVAVVVVMHLFAGWMPRRFGPGESWACVAVGLVFAADALLYMAVIRSTSRIPFRAQLAALAPPILACVPMVAVVAALEGILAGVAPPGLRLAVEIAAGAVVFVPSALLLAPGTSREFLALLAAALRGATGAPAVRGSGIC